MFVPYYPCSLERSNCLVPQPPEKLSARRSYVGLLEKPDSRRSGPDAHGGSGNGPRVGLTVRRSRCRIPPHNEQNPVGIPRPPQAFSRVGPCRTASRNFARSVVVESGPVGISDTFSAAEVAELAGPRVFPRGVGYCADGRVERPVTMDQRIEATVRGSVPYSVALWIDAGEPKWSCTCPYAEDGLFCKHCVAVALSAAPDEIRPSTFAAESIRPAEPLGDPDLTSYVEGLPHERLVDIVLEQCESDWALLERLDAEARADPGDGPKLASWRRRIDIAFAPHGEFVPYGEVDRWAAGVLDVIVGLERLADAGHGGAVIVLAEHAHRCADAASQYIDDSAGWLTEIEGRLSELHLAACRSTRPDPVALARRLVDLELASELDGFRGAAAFYSGVLGETGIAEYRRILKPRWEAVKNAESIFANGRSRIERAMAGVATASGDPDALIEVLSERKLGPRDYLEIATSLVDFDRDEEAIAWIRRGMAEWASQPYQLRELRGLLADLFEARGEHEVAVQQFWEGFEAEPSLATYRALLARAGVDAASQSKRCIDELRARLASVPPDDTRSWPADGFRLAAPLIQILMYEGDIDAAWEVASTHGAADAVWWDLAAARESSHPLDSIPVYEREVFSHIAQRKRRSYRAAVDLLAHIQYLADRAGDSGVFEVIVEHVRTEHRAKWSLMEMLDRKKW